MIRYLARFSGHVQGVGFRATCVAEARDLNVHGTVRNEPDGSVLLDVDGPAGDLKELIRRIEVAMKGNIDAVVIDQSESKQRSGGLRISF